MNDAENGYDESSPDYTEFDPEQFAALERKRDDLQEQLQEVMVQLRELRRKRSYENKLGQSARNAALRREGVPGCCGIKYWSVEMWLGLTRTARRKREIPHCGAIGKNFRNGYFYCDKHDPERKQSTGRGQ